MTEGKFTVTFDLTQDQMADLLAECRRLQKPVGEVGPIAIADYLSRTTPALEKVLSLD